MLNILSQCPDQFSLFLQADSRFILNLRDIRVELVWFPGRNNENRDAGKRTRRDMRAKRATQIQREPVAYLFTPRPSCARTCDVVNACTEVFRNRYLALFSSYRCGAHWYRGRRIPWTSRSSRSNVQFRETKPPLPSSLSPISTSGIDYFCALLSGNSSLSLSFNLDLVLRSRTMSETSLLNFSLVRSD